MIARLAAVALLVATAAEAHDIYGNWLVPGSDTSPCCAGKDCRPTRAYSDEDGLWHAWNGKRWLPIPPDRVLPTDYAHDGRSHLCENEDTVYCFSPGPVLR